MTGKFGKNWYRGYWAGMHAQHTHGQNLAREAQNIVHVASFIITLFEHVKPFKLGSLNMQKKLKHAKILHYCRSTCSVKSSGNVLGQKLVSTPCSKLEMTIVEYFPPILCFFIHAYKGPFK
jgi:hypothetical protein